VAVSVSARRPARLFGTPARSGSVRGGERGAAGRDQPVSDAADGLDGRPVVAQLLPQLRDMDIDGPRLAREVRPPDVLQEAIAGQDDPGVARERGKQVELARPQLEAALADRGLAAPAVDAQRADLDRAGAGCRPGRTPEDCPDACDQGPRVEGLRDVVVGAQLQPDDGIHVVRTGGEHEDRRLAAPANLATDVEAILLRQHEVQDHEVRVVPEVERERLVPIARGDHPEALLLEVEPEELHDVRLVVDDEDAFHVVPESTVRRRAPRAQT